nr:MAG TPA: hypothetical protein [Caudoviricetes sp.]
MAQARRQPMCYNSSVDETANRQRRRFYHVETLLR